MEMHHILILTARTKYYILETLPQFGPYQLNLDLIIPCEDIIAQNYEMYTIIAANYYLFWTFLRTILAKML